MAVPVDFTRSRGEYLVDRVANGRPIEGLGGVDDLLALAGACLFAARTQAGALQSRVDGGRLPERVRSGPSDLARDLHAAIDVYAELAESVYDMWFEEVYEDRVRAIVYTDGERRAVVPLEGYRTRPDGGPHAHGPLGV